MIAGGFGPTPDDREAFPIAQFDLAWCVRKEDMRGFPIEAAEDDGANLPVVTHLLNQLGYEVAVQWLEFIGTLDEVANCQENGS